ncbi:hypothetical protein KVT40_008059 [Elsinoe batatas]|uniref:Uncharacterized protein n=1 Tax=Elsinoe batatas TaxID=2601811 RepID=A0A8K0PDH3_9PEZI|nr:hypothetical protein KVT40_008059 [Elsinoe batatas]
MLVSRPTPINVSATRSPTWDDYSSDPSPLQAPIYSALRSTISHQGLLGDAEENTSPVPRFDPPGASPYAHNWLQEQALESFPSPTFAGKAPAEGDHVAASTAPSSVADEGEDSHELPGPSPQAETPPQGLRSPCNTNATTKHGSEEEKAPGEAEYLLVWDQTVYPRRRDIRVDIPMKGKGPKLDGQLATVLQELALSEQEDFAEVLKTAVYLYEEGLDEQLNAFHHEFTHIYHDLRRSISNALNPKLRFADETEWTEKLAQSSENDRPKKRRRQRRRGPSKAAGVDEMKFDVRAPWANDTADDKSRKADGGSRRGKLVIG